MKHNQDFLGHYTRRLLMIFAMISLWQMSIQATDVKAGTYYDTKINGITYRVWTYTLYQGTYASVQEIPNVETVRIPAKIQYEGKYYDVRHVKLAGDKVKDVYVDSIYQHDKYNWYGPDVTNLSRDAIIHLKPSNFYHFSPTTHLVTDGKRWKGYTKAQKDGFTFEITYTSGNPNAKITEAPLNQDGLTFPADLAIRDTILFPVTKIKWFKFASNVKDIYFTRAIPTKDTNTTTTETIFHVPDSLFDKAISKLGSYMRFTTGTDFAFTNSKTPYCTINLDGYQYEIFSKSRDNKYARVAKLPNLSQVTIAADVMYLGYKIPVTDFSNSRFYNGLFEEDGKNVKDVYFTRMIPSENSNFINYFRPGNKNTVIHVPDSLFEKATDSNNQLYRTFYHYRITDGLRWACPVQFRTHVNEATYRIYYTKGATNPYAELEKINLSEIIKIPAEINDEYTTYPVKSIASGVFKLNDAVKHIYFTKCLPINIYKNGNYNATIIHVPDSLYNKALATFGNYWRITNGKEMGFTGKNGVNFEQNGFIYNLTLNSEDAPYATIIGLPEKETVYLPTEVTENNIIYPIKEIGKKNKSENVYEIILNSTIKDVYVANLIPNLARNGENLPISLHVPDSLFEKAMQSAETCYAKHITDGKRNAYNQEYSNFSYRDFYDIENTGTMSVIPGGYTLLDEKGTPYTISYGYQGLTITNYKTKETVLQTNDIQSPTIADINGDGRKEIVSKLDLGYNKFFRLSPNGTFIEDLLFVTSDTTVVNSMMLDDYTPNSSTITPKNDSGVGSIGYPGQGMFVEAKPAPDWDDWQEYDNITSETSQAKQVITNNGKATRAMAISSGYLSAADVNGDGMIDLYDGDNIYYNLGRNKFFKSPHKGTVYSADLTGNGLLDFIDFGNKQVDLYLSMAENSDMQVKTLLKNTAISNTFFGDFDKDGDVDILFVIPGSDYTIFQFYRNDGNGVFKPKDTDIDGAYTCIACNDYDGDGYLEILAKQKNTEIYSLFKCKNWTISAKVLPGEVKTIADINNDGKMDLLYEYKSYYQYNYCRYLVHDFIEQIADNKRPQKMEKPSAVAYADAGKLKISWTRGKDAETSACDLTYELRIGSESGKGDIYFGKSNADGTRRVLEDGNMGRALKYMFDTNNLSEGKYYIAIQAIDAGGLGGPWSDELVYDHKLSAPAINNISEGYCTSDTITLTVQNPRNDATYEWALSNGTVISQNDNGSIVQVIFENAGEQKVGLTMTLGEKQYQAKGTKIILAPFKYEPLKATDSDYQLITSGYTRIDYLDINQDGIAEVYSAWSAPYSNKKGQKGFFEKTDNNTWSKVRKTWNSDLTANDIIPCDINRDGYPDFLTKEEKGTIFYNSGEGDKSFDYETIETNINNFRTYPSYTTDVVYIDINNNGKLGLRNKSQLFYQEGNSLNVNMQEETRYCGGLYDFNRDGGIDIWKNNRNHERQKAETLVYFKKAGEENVFENVGKVFYENDHEFDMSGFADINNDGYMDGYFFDKPEGKDYYNMVIVKGKPINEWPCTQTVIIPLHSNNVTLLDLDNNGFLDIFPTGYNINGNSDSDCSVLLMDKDFTYTEIKNAKSQFGINSNLIDEYHWQPLTPGAYPNGYKSSIKNEAPSVPAHVTATSVPEGLLLKWDDATDDHTPWMQMRYNVSLKIKGKTGENAFVLSPMNGLSDEAAICSGVYYRKATQLIVPKTALVNGTTYELQVQAIDLMGEHSAMTKPVEVTYNAEKMIMIDDNEHYTGLAYYGKCTNVSGNDFTINPGEGGTVLQHSDGGIFSLKWNTPGVKTITFKDGNDVITKLVNVKLLPDLTINLPERVMLNTPLTVRVPECFQTGKYDDFGFKESEVYKATFEKGDTIATIVFKEVGEQSLQPYVKIEKDLTLSEQFKTMVIDETMPAAEIKSVESNDKYYQVNWSTDVPSMVSKVEVSRETNRLNQFEVLDIVPVGNATYVDLTSDNRVQPQRYRIRLIAENEMQHSDYSAAHNPLHVMINKTADKKGNNLMWNAYEGLEVTSYIIMRGSSEKNLKAIATISGSQQNYTDYDAPAGVSYYAVKFETNTSAGAKGMGRVAASEDVSSNVISSEEAMPTTQATTLYAGTVESIAKLSNSQQQLHMVATILPTFVTFNKVSWSIVSGGEYASISQSGLLTAKGGKGDVVVRVVTLDGSNLSSEITIPCDVNILASDIDVRASKKTVAVGDYLLLNAVLTPKNTTMSEVTWKSENTDVATIDENGILKAISTGTVKITATTKDGSNLSAFIKITVTEASGIHGVTIEDENENTEFYDLEGRKIQTPQKGRVYITNKGQKIAF